MKVTGKLLKIEFPSKYGVDYVLIRHLKYSGLVWTMKLDELVELSSLTEALLQELKGEDNADKSNRRP